MKIETNIIHEVEESVPWDEKKHGQTPQLPEGLGPNEAAIAAQCWLAREKTKYRLFLEVQNPSLYAGQQFPGVQAIWQKIP